MKTSAKAFFFFFLPLLVTLFYQAEKGRIVMKEQGIYQGDEQSELSPAAADDSISLFALDDDEDDSSESVVRCLPVVALFFVLTSLLAYRTASPVPVSCKISYRENSPSFLKVFRI